MPHMSATRTTKPTPAEQRQVNIAIILRNGARIIETAQVIKAPITRALEAVCKWLNACGFRSERLGDTIIAGLCVLKWDARHLRWACTGKVGRALGTVFGVRLCAEMLAGEVTQ